jgi:hypothetical protein
MSTGCNISFFIESLPNLRMIPSILFGLLIELEQHETIVPLYFRAIKYAP